MPRTHATYTHLARVQRLRLSDRRPRVAAGTTSITRTASGVASHTTASSCSSSSARRELTEQHREQQMRRDAAGDWRRSARAEPGGTVAAIAATAAVLPR